MKRFITYAAALLMSLTTMAEMRQALILHTVDGGNIVYYLADQPIVTFQGQDIVVTTADDGGTVPMDDVEYCEVGMADYTAVKAVDSQHPAVHVCGGMVTVTNPAGADINVYNVAGAVVASSRQSVAELSLDRGIYIITVGNHTFKIKN